MPLVVRNPECLSLGRNVHLGEYVHIRAGGGVTIGDNVAIAAHVTIASQGHPTDLPRCHGPHWSITEAPVVIEDDVWVGSGAIILPGTRVGRGAVVAAGAVVSRDVPALSVVAGVPARPIGEVCERRATGEETGCSARLAS